jgi:hypothetical protein
LPFVGTRRWQQSKRPRPSAGSSSAWVSRRARHRSRFRRSALSCRPTCRRSSCVAPLAPVGECVSLGRGSSRSLLLPAADSLNPPGTGRRMSPGGGFGMGVAG